MNLNNFTGPTIHKWPLNNGITNKLTGICRQFDILFSGLVDVNTCFLFFDY